MAERHGNAAMPQRNGSFKRHRQSSRTVSRSQRAGTTASLFTQHFVEAMSSRLGDGTQMVIRQAQTGSLNGRWSQQRALLLAAEEFANLTLGQIRKL